MSNSAATLLHAADDLLDRANLREKIDRHFRRHLKSPVLEYGALRMSGLVLRHFQVPRADQIDDLRTKHLNHGSHPAIEIVRWLVDRNFEPLKHPDHVFARVPGLAGHPAIGGEKPDNAP